MSSIRRNIQSYLGLSENGFKQREASLSPTDLPILYQSEAFSSSSSSQDASYPKTRDLRSPNRNALGRINPPASLLCNLLINANGYKHESCDEPTEIFGKLDFSVGKHTFSSPSSCGLALVAGDELKRLTSVLEASERPNARRPVNRIHRLCKFEKSVNNGRAFPNEDSSPMGDLMNMSNATISSDSDGIGKGKCSFLTEQKSGIGFKKTSSRKFSETLKLCTEGLGFESSDEKDADSVSVGSDSTASSPRFPLKSGVEWEKCKANLSDDGGLMIYGESQKHTLENDGNSSISSEADIDNCNLNHWEIYNGGMQKRCHATSGKRRPRAIHNFPPPVSSIARNGHPWVFLKSYRKDGRLFLHEVKVPQHDFLRAWRGDGRLKLQFVQQHESLPSPPRRDQSPVGDFECNYSEEEEGTGDAESIEEGTY